MSLPLQINSAEIVAWAVLWLHEHERLLLLALAAAYVLYAWALIKKDQRARRQKKIGCRIAVISVCWIAMIHVVDYLIKGIELAGRQVWLV